MFFRVRRVLIFLVGLTIPMQGIAVNAGTAAAATPFKLMVGVLLVLAGVEFALGRGARLRDAKTLWVIMFMFSFAVASAMSVLGGVPILVILGPGTTMAALSLYYFLLSYTVHEYRDLRAVLWGTLVGGMVTLGPAIQLMRSSMGVQAERFGGLAGQSNVLGGDMAICFAIAAGLFFTTQRASLKLLAFFGGALALMGVALSLSRAAFVSVGIMWLVWIVRAGSRGNLQVAIVAIMLGALTILAAPGTVRDRFFTMVDARQRQEDYSIQSRVDTYVVALKAIASNPVIGVGTERFRLWAYEEREGGTHTVHNGYLYIAAEQGLFGFIPFMALLLLSWRDYSSSFRTAQRHRLIRDGPLMEYGNLALYMQLALLSIMIGALFHQQHRSKALWTLMALSPLVTSLVRLRVAEIRGLLDEDEPGRARPALDEGPFAGHHLAP